MGWKAASSILALAVLLILPGCGPAIAATAATPSTVTGIVQADGVPLANAVVRVQTTELATQTDASGRFTLALESEGPVSITAWASGYFISVAEAQPGDENLEITLTPHGSQDYPDYDWVSAYAESGEESACQHCHSNPAAATMLPFDEWITDAHAGSAQNPRFLTMYLGTDTAGHSSPPTRLGYNLDYGSFPLPPDLSQPYYGPGYRLDFPNTTGNCAACHLPAAAIDDPYGIDPAQVEGVAAEGIGCDFCHKVWAVTLDPGTGLPQPNMPGVLSMEFRRPEDGHQFFAGPLDDVAPGEDTYSPVQRESAYCASCHYGVFWDTLVYNSYGEWLDSPYSDPQTGQTCQDCHMPQSGADHFARLDVGGLRRDPGDIASHRMPGASDEALLQNALTMQVEASRSAGGVAVSVNLINDLTGHHVPTDSPLRHLILLVSARDESGQALEQLDGPVLPDWAGLGDPEQGYYAGLPGTAYAKVLEEWWTGIAPTGAYWNMTRVQSDNRIPALGHDLTQYRFASPPSGAVTIEVRLLFRRAYITLMDQKGWADPDRLMESQSLVLNSD